MERKRIKYLTEVKTLEDLNLLKMQKRYMKDLKKIEFETSLLHLNRNISAEKIAETFSSEVQNLAQRFALKYFPSFLLKFFK